MIRVGPHRAGERGAGEMFEQNMNMLFFPMALFLLTTI